MGENKYICELRWDNNSIDTLSQYLLEILIKIKIEIEI